MSDFLATHVLRYTKNVSAYGERLSALASMGVLSVLHVLGKVQHLEIRQKRPLQNLRKTSFGDAIENDANSRNTRNHNLKSTACEFPVTSCCSWRLE